MLPEGTVKLCDREELLKLGTEVLVYVQMVSLVLGSADEIFKGLYVCKVCKCPYDGIGGVLLAFNGITGNVRSCQSASLEYFYVYIRLIVPHIADEKPQFL